MIASSSLLALLAPLIAPYDPIADQLVAGAQGRRRRRTGSAPTNSAATSWPASSIGARASLLAGVVSVAIALAIGVPLGLVAGYRGGLSMP